ncbi:hypothetical protein [Castellaniella sp.]
MKSQCLGGWPQSSRGLVQSVGQGASGHHALDGLGRSQQLFG